MRSVVFTLHDSPEAMGRDMSTPHRPNVYRRLAGMLRVAAHSAVLETNDERVFRLIAAEDLSRFDGHAVIVEGTLAGTDRLQLEWIGDAPE